MVVGISASGTTPYVVGGLKTCQEQKIYTGSITCNEKMKISKMSQMSEGPWIDCVASSTK